MSAAENLEVSREICIKEIKRIREILSADVTGKQILSLQEFQSLMMDLEGYRKALEAFD